MDGDHEVVVAAVSRLLVVVFADQGGNRGRELLREGRRSAAEENRTSPSMAKVASGLPALAEPVSRSPTSRTSRAATASNQRADSRSGERAGSGPTGPRAFGEMTYDEALARISRSVTFPFLRSSTSSTSPYFSNARRW